MKVQIAPFISLCREQLEQAEASREELNAERVQLDTDILNWGRLGRYLRRRAQLNAEIARLRRAVTP